MHVDDYLMHEKIVRCSYSFINFLFQALRFVHLRVYSVWYDHKITGTLFRNSPIQVEAVADDCSAWDLKNDHSRSGDNESLFLGLRAGHRLLCVNNHELACSDGELNFLDATSYDL